MKPVNEEDIHQEGRGRSAKKREARAIEKLAQTLAELPEPELAKLPMDDELAREVEIARNTRRHGPRKRQIKHLAGVLRRREDMREAVTAALDRQATTQRQETMAFDHLEKLRDRFCSTDSFDEALAEIRSTYPHIDDRKLTRLARAVQEHDDKKAAREIFRRLRKASEKSEE